MKQKDELVIGPLQHQLNVDVRADVESFDAIFAVRREAENVQVQIFHESMRKKRNLNLI